VKFTHQIDKLNALILPICILHAFQRSWVSFITRPKFVTTKTGTSP